MRTAIGLFIGGVMALWFAMIFSVIAKADPPPPTIPPSPPLPTYIVKNDGTQLQCDTQVRVCWE